MTRKTFVAAVAVVLMVWAGVVVATAQEKPATPPAQADPQMTTEQRLTLANAAQEVEIHKARMETAQLRLNEIVRALAKPGYEIDLSQPTGYRKAAGGGQP